jgi:hypothetical protein
VAACCCDGLVEEELTDWAEVVFVDFFLVGCAVYMLVG